MDSLQQAYRACFSAASGRRVLEDLVVRSGLLNPSDTNIERQNFVKEILNQCGLFEHTQFEHGCGAHKSVGALMNKLFELPYNERDTNG